MSVDIERKVVYDETLTPDEGMREIGMTTERTVVELGDDGFGSVEVTRPARDWENQRVGLTPPMLTAIRRGYWGALMPPGSLPTYACGDRVLKHTGDYRLEGTVVSSFQTLGGKWRYVVEHDMGILHIYSDANLRYPTKAPTEERRLPNDIASAEYADAIGHSPTCGCGCRTKKE